MKPDSHGGQPMRNSSGHKKTCSKLNHHTSHAKKSRWLTKIFPQIFTSVIGPLAVGLTLQGFKGCDSTSAQTPPKALGHLARSQDQQRRCASVCAVGGINDEKLPSQGNALMHP